ncbi:MAG: hypothetical protein FWF05_08685 [Oscillospiraceae bacterium]|nr:hypothetical protein [Oscillospiraceae bacterium]
MNKAVIIGGDERQIYMAGYFNGHGFRPELYGFDRYRKSGGRFCVGDLETAIKGAEIVILPIPASLDGGITVNAPYSDSTITFDSLIRLIDPDKAVFAGMMSKTMRSVFFKKGVRVYDYADRDEFTIRNAVPTAEGVVEIAISKLPTTIKGSKVAVTGYGKTGKAVAKSMGSLGAFVTVAARKCSDVSQADNDGHTGIYLRELYKCAWEFDVLVNTVPAVVADEKVLKNLRPDCLILEIASAPYGVDMNAAKALGLEVVIAGSLPGKCAPKSAGIIISETILNIIKEGSE